MVLLVLNVVLKHGTYRPKTRSYLIVALYYVFNSMLAVGVGCISKWIFEQFWAGGLPVRGTTHLALERK